MTQGDDGDDHTGRFGDGGRREAMWLFYKEHQPKLRKYVERRVRDPIDAEDVCQEIWQAFFVRYDDYVATYGRAVKVLYPIARCRVADFWRQRGQTREELVEGEDLARLADAMCSRQGVWPGVDSRIDLQRALAAMTPRQREALHLHYVDDLKTSQVASLMGRSEDAVKKLLRKARKTLRMLLLGDYGPEGEYE